MYKYRLYFLADCDDSNPKTYESSPPVSTGDIIELPETGFHHLVVRIHVQKTGVRLDLSESAQSPDDAILLATQLGQWPN